MHWFQYVNKCTCGNYNTFTLIRQSGVNIKSQQLPVYKDCVYTYIQGFMQDKIIASHTCFGRHMDVNC